MSETFTIPSSGTRDYGFSEVVGYYDKIEGWKQEDRAIPNGASWNNLPFRHVLYTSGSSAAIFGLNAIAAFKQAYATWDNNKVPSYIELGAEPNNYSGVVGQMIVFRHIDSYQITPSYVDDGQTVPRTLQISTSTFGVTTRDQVKIDEFIQAFNLWLSSRKKNLN